MYRIINKHNMALKWKSIKQGQDEDTDMDSDNEMFMNNENKTKKNWPRFLIVRSADEDIPLQKLSPFTIQKGFQAIDGTLKSIKRLTDGSFMAECGKRAQAQNLLQTNCFVDRPVRVSVHKTLNSSRGVIRCRGPC